jgi:hypothetical protein
MFQPGLRTRTGVAAAHVNRADALWTSSALWQTARYKWSANMRKSLAEYQQAMSHGGMGAATTIKHGAGKPGPLPPRIVWVKSATGWVAA